MGSSCPKQNKLSGIFCNLYMSCCFLWAFIVLLGFCLFILISTFVEVLGIHVFLGFCFFRKREVRRVREYKVVWLGRWQDLEGMGGGMLKIYCMIIFKKFKCNDAEKWIGIKQITQPTSPYSVIHLSALPLTSLIIHSLSCVMWPKMLCSTAFLLLLKLRKLPSQWPYFSSTNTTSQPWGPGLSYLFPKVVLSPIGSGHTWFSSDCSIFYLLCLSPSSPILSFYPMWSE